MDGLSRHRCCRSLIGKATWGGGTNWYLLQHHLVRVNRLLVLGHAHCLMRVRPAPSSRSPPVATSPPNPILCRYWRPLPTCQCKSSPPRARPDPTQSTVLTNLASLRGSHFRVASASNVDFSLCVVQLHRPIFDAHHIAWCGGRPGLTRCRCSDSQCIHHGGKRRAVARVDGAESTGR